MTSDRAAGATASPPPGGDVGEFRVVFRSGPHGALVGVYPVHASNYTAPIATFTLAPTQELPVMLPGAVVRALPDLSELYVGNVIIRTGRRITPDGQAPIFAERGGVLVNPQTPSYEHSWRDVAAEATHGVTALEARVARQRRQFRLVVALDVVVLIAGVAIWIAGQPGTTLRLWAYATIWFFTSFAAWRRARRSQSALDSARAVSDTPGGRMQMRLWWSVGSGRGPVPVATLTPMLWSADPVEYQVPLANIPELPFPTTPVGVTVRGDPATGQSPSIRWGDVTLWPADPTAIERAQRHLDDADDE